MKNSRKPEKNGFTIVELLIGISVVIIVTFGSGIVIANSQRAFQVTYDKVNAYVVTDSYVVRKLFDATVRKSQASAITVGSKGEYAQFKYYNNSYSTYLDRYTRFYISDENLKAEYGTLSSGGVQTITETQTVCENVSSCFFKNNGSSVSMILTLDDGSKSNVVITSAYAHN